MYKLEQLPTQNSFSELSPELFSYVQPQGLEAPFLVSANSAAAELIGLDPGELTSDKFLQVFSGNHVPPIFKPLAMVYSGHQFGSYNPQLGDGRGLLLGEVEHPDNGKWDLHLKGAGQTPYSRFGDGRAVLRSSIREYLCSEAMHGLGIPTTRALCVIGSKTPVYRETPEYGATVLRLARSHIRFGHFEYFHYNKRPDIVKQLADYVIDQQFPEIATDTDRYGQFLSAIVKRTAKLIAKWQAVGFAHGVMNTDNMSIVGDTFDYGPFGFLDDYNPEYICNHSDHEGRYAFNQQPGIGLWNLNALAHSLSSLIDQDTLRDALTHYQPELVEHYNLLFRAKLGLVQSHQQDSELFSTLLALMHADKLDYTNTFRMLSTFNPDEENSFKALRDKFINRPGIDLWIDQYQRRLVAENIDFDTRKHAMNKANPKYILRNYLAQQAIDSATQHSDYSAVNHLLAILQHPYDEQPENDNYATDPPDWGKKLSISCSS